MAIINGKEIPLKGTFIWASPLEVKFIKKIVGKINAVHNGKGHPKNFLKNLLLINILIVVLIRI
jgi:hypothetical protein